MPPIVHSTSWSGTIWVTVLRTLYFTRPGMSFSGVRSISMSNTSPTAVSGLAVGRCFEHARSVDADVALGAGDDLEQRVR